MALISIKTEAHFQMSEEYYFGSDAKVKTRLYRWKDGGERREDYAKDGKPTLVRESCILGDEECIVSYFFNAKGEMTERKEKRSPVHQAKPVCA